MYYWHLICCSDQKHPSSLALEANYLTYILFARLGIVFPFSFDNNGSFGSIYTY